MVKFLHEVHIVLTFSELEYEPGRTMMDRAARMKNTNKKV